METNKKNPLKSTAWVKKTGATPQGRKPYLKGFVNVNKAQIEALLSQYEPDQYGNYKLSVALWVDNQDSGVLKGTAEPPHKKPDTDVVF